jgi:hypothetical protein
VRQIRRGRDSKGDKDPLRGSVTIGYKTYFTYGYSCEVLAEQFVKPELERQLADAEAAYGSGRHEALSDAIELLRVHSPNAPWPDWVQQAVAAQTKSLWQADPQPGVGKGRHARAATRRKDDACDIIRATYVDCLIWSGLKKAAVCRELSESLGGDVGGSEKAMLDSHRRFHKRVATEPNRYYPLLGWRLRLLNAAASSHASRRKIKYLKSST